MNNYDKLMESLEIEMQAFEDSYKSMSKTQIYNDWYIIGFYNEYYDMLTSQFADELDVSSDMITWLSSKESPLRFLYDKWLSYDGAFSHDWDDMLNFVKDIYYAVKHQEKQDMYYEIKALDINVVKNASDEFFDGFDYITHISHNPIVSSVKFNNGFDNDINKNFEKFFQENMLVKSCDYGCNTYPNGVSNNVAPNNIQTYSQPVWNFIEAVEQMFECQCTFYNEANGFEFVFAFGEDENKGCYVFGAGNNGQEFSQCLYFSSPEQINNPDFVKVITTIDKALYMLLEEHNLRFNTKTQEASLEDKISEAKEIKEASLYDGYPTLEEIRSDYSKLMEQTKDVRTIDAVKQFQVKYPVEVEINGVSLNEFVKNGGTDKDIEWIRYEVFGCLSYVYDRFDDKPMFDVWCKQHCDEFIHDKYIEDFTEENYKKWVEEDYNSTVVPFNHVR